MTVELPPYREMPPEVRLRLRKRVLPTFTDRSGHRAPYLVAAAIIVVASAAAALLMSPVRHAAPPAAQPSPTPTVDPGLAAGIRVSQYCPNHTSGLWLTGPYLPRANGDGIQLTLEARTNTLGICRISGGQGKWSATVFDIVSGSTYQAIHDDGVIYGLAVNKVFSVTIDNGPAAFDTGMFIADAPAGQVTLVARDAQGKVVGQGTIN
jgi:hypothetical protein